MLPNLGRGLFEPFVEFGQHIEGGMRSRGSARGALVPLLEQRSAAQFGQCAPQEDAPDDGLLDAGGQLDWYRAAGGTVAQSCPERVCKRIRGGSPAHAEHGGDPVEFRVNNSAHIRFLAVLVPIRSPACCPDQTRPKVLKAKGFGPIIGGLWLKRGK